MPLEIVSHIDFAGIIGSDITDTNGQKVSKNVAGSNTIDKDGSGNGVFFIDSAEGGLALSMDMLSEPITADIDLLDKDFEITFTDFQMTCAGFLWVVIPFVFGNLATGNGYVIQRVMTEGAFWVFKLVNGVVGDTNVYTDPVGFSLLAKHTYKIKRESGIISFLIDDVASTKTASPLDGQTWDSYAGTGQIYFGNLYDIGRDLTLTIGDFKIELEGSSPAPSGGVSHKKKKFGNVIVERPVKFMGAPTFHKG